MHQVGFHYMTETIYYFCNYPPVHIYTISLTNRTLLIFKSIRVWPSAWRPATVKIFPKSLQTFMLHRFHTSFQITGSTKLTLKSFFSSWYFLNKHINFISLWNQKIHQHVHKTSQVNLSPSQFNSHNQKLFLWDLF